MSKFTAYFHNLKRQSGFSLIEIIIAGAIITISFTGITTFLLTLEKNSIDTVSYNKAVNLARNGLEAVRKLRDDSWSNITSNIGQTKTVELSNGQFVLHSVVSFQNGYETTVTFSSVYRDSSFNIQSSGTLDPDTVKVDSTVSYYEGCLSYYCPTNLRTLTLTTYLTNFNQ